VVIRAVTLVILWPALFADFSPRLAAQIRYSTGKHRKWSRIASKGYIQSDTTNPPGNQIRAAEFLKDIFENPRPETLLAAGQRVFD
jgi:hypothetical protein